MKQEKCCTTGCVETSVGARTGADIVGAMLVSPEELGINMRERALEGVDIGREAIADPLRAMVGSAGSSEDVREAVRRALHR